MAEQKDFIFISCVVVINGFGMLNNFLVVIMFFWFHKKLLSVNDNKFLFSMAIADCLVGLFGVTGGTLIYLQEFKLIPIEIMKLYGVLPVFGSFFMSILSLIILIADRLIAVVYALRYEYIITEFRANLLVCATWLVVAVILVIQAAIYIKISEEVEINVRIYELTTFFTFGTLVLSIGNIKLHFIIRKKRERISTSIRMAVIDKTDTTEQNNGIFKLRKKLMRTLSDGRICIWMTVLFIICWLPAVIWYVAYTNGYLDHPITNTYTICISLAASNSLLNPVIYLFKRKDFRTLFRKLFIPCKTNSKTEVIK